MLNDRLRMVVFFTYNRYKNKKLKENIIRVNTVSSQVSPLTPVYPFLLKHYYKYNSSFERHKKFILGNQLKTIMETI